MQILTIYNIANTNELHVIFDEDDNLEDER